MSKTHQPFLAQLLAPMLLPLALLLAPAAYAEDLFEVYHAIIKNDPAWLAREYEFKADLQVKGQGRAGLLPLITGAANTKENSDTRENEETEDYKSDSFQIQLSQPLIDLEKWHQYKANKAISEKAALEFEAARQENIYDAAVIYFDVLRAEDDLALANAEEQTLKNQLEIIQQKAEAGVATQTEVLETQAAFNLAQVNQILSAGQVRYRKEILTTHSAIEKPSLAHLKSDFQTLHVDPLNEDFWVHKAITNSQNLKSLKYDTDIALQNYRQQRTSSLPKLEFVATYAESDFEGGEFKPSGKAESYGVQISAPLFAGFGDFYASKEYKMKYLQNTQESEAERRTLVQAARNRFRSIYTDVLTANAHAISVQSLEKALNAVRAEHEAGARDLVDVLDAQKSLFLAKKDLAHSRYNYILDKLQLQQFVGDLDEDDLLEVNRSLIQ